MLKRLRERARSEKGFTLIELLVVMLILGILAAIAIPAFLNQKGKANDSAMKVQVRTMQTAMETCSTDNNTGTYTGCTAVRLNAIEPTIPAAGPVVTVPPAGTSYTITSQAATGTGNTFTISKAAPPTATVTHTCLTQGSGGCPPGGNW
jgi:type IV pilus assembly protein PilA